MPLTKKGKSVMKSLREKHGEEAEEIFYRMKNAGTIEGVDALPKRRKTQSYDPQGREAGSYETEEDSGGQFRLPLFVMVADAPPDNRMMYDAVDIDDDAKLEITSDGYLKAMPRIARTGIQLYKGDECGRPDLDIVRVFRPEASVFASDATHSYTHLPITIEHPGVTVDAGNWKKHAVGETGDEVLRDGGTVRVPMMLRDSKAIKLVKDGKRQLSVGYGCDLSWGDGVSPEGEQYDAVQSNIRANHLALVSAARGGPSLAIGDRNTDGAVDKKLFIGLLDTVYADDGRVLFKDCGYCDG